MKKVIKLNAPSWEVSAKKAHNKEIAKLKIIQEEFARIQAEQEA